MTNDIKIPQELAERLLNELSQCSVRNELLALLAAPVVERQESDIEIAARLVEGKTVSVDVSTGDQDAGNRLFCTIVEVMEDGDSFTLLAVDPEPNFEASPPAPVAVVLPARRDTPEYWNPYQNPSAERACGWNGYDDELKRLNPGLFAKVKD